MYYMYVVQQSHGFHPRSAGLTNRMPARDTVEGLAILRWQTSSMSLMEGLRGIRSLLASVKTCLTITSMEYTHVRTNVQMYIDTCRGEIL